MTTTAGALPNLLVDGDAGRPGVGRSLRHQAILGRRAGLGTAGSTVASTATSAVASAVASTLPTAAASTPSVELGGPVVGRVVVGPPGLTVLLGLARRLPGVSIGQLAAQLSVGALLALDALEQVGLEKFPLGADFLKAPQVPLVDVGDLVVKVVVVVSPELATTRGGGPRSIPRRGATPTAFVDLEEVLDFRVDHNARTGLVRGMLGNGGAVIDVRRSWGAAGRPPDVRLGHGVQVPELSGLNSKNSSRTSPLKRTSEEKVAWGREATPARKSTSCLPKA